MRADTAIQHIRSLMREGRDADVRWRDDGRLTAWRNRCQTILNHALGEKNRISESFSKIWFIPGSMDRNIPQSRYVEALREGMTSAFAYLDSAIFELELVSTSDDAIDNGAFDPELWEHVKGHVEAGEWQKVASQTAIFVEHHIRQWCGDPRGQDGGKLVGKRLYAQVFGDRSQFKLGTEAGETEGWRSLAMGFAQATGNVDRHNLQERGDAKRYALGVLGLGSLLLTQLRFQHDDKLKAGGAT